jgi:hypothetical protein
MEESIGAVGTEQPFANKKDGDNTEVRSLHHGENDLLQGEIVDQVLAAKMNLINDVSEEDTVVHKAKSELKNG